MTVCDIDHTRHGNPLRSLAQIFSRLATYTLLDQTSSFKPARIHD
ncbi:hypothetical protein [Pontibacter mucosus]|nr:hypothetical protein [Pontibacter mucosus]